MPDETMPPNSWDDQKPELTAENADEVVRMIDDIRLLVEHGEADLGYCSIYRPTWDPSKIPSNLEILLPKVGIQVSIGRDRGGSWSQTGEGGERESGSYHAPVDIQLSVPLKHDFYPVGQFVNLWFDGQKGEHEDRVLGAVLGLRAAIIRMIDWYFGLIDDEVPSLVQVAKIRLAASAGSHRRFVETMGG